MIAITAATEHLNSKYLKDCTLYVTLEPCLMCAGAIHWSQVPHVIYGAKDSKRGYYSRNESPESTVSIEGGILAEKCQEILQQFFKEKRQG